MSSQIWHSNINKYDDLFFKSLPDHHIFQQSYLSSLNTHLSHYTPYFLLLYTPYFLPIYTPYFLLLYTPYFLLLYTPYFLLLYTPYFLLLYTPYFLLHYTPYFLLLYIFLTTLPISFSLHSLFPSSLHPSSLHSLFPSSLYLQPLIHVETFGKNHQNSFLTNTKSIFSSFSTSLNVIFLFSSLLNFVFHTHDSFSNQNSSEILPSKFIMPTPYHPSTLSNPSICQQTYPLKSPKNN